MLINPVMAKLHFTAAIAVFIIWSD